MRDLMHDMLLLENQMPIRIMEGLLSFVDLSSLNESEMVMVTIYDLAQKFFKIIGFTSKVPLAAHHSKARHFVEFLLFLHDPPEGYVSSFDKRPRRQVESTDFCQNATELVKAGVVLRSSESNWLHEISFSYEDGVLTIPELTIDALTEPFFKNLIAFEHLGRYGYFSKKFTSYVMLLETLIRTPGDVDILVEVGIIENRFGSSRQVAALFNNLTRGILTEGVYDFYFYGLFMELKYYRRSLLNPGKGSLYRWRIILRVMSYKWNEWKWILGRDYFSNPWSTLSIVAGFLLLVLTLIQAVCSILQVA
ncbi:UPF0481 protein At3g47200-like isoform X2 [Salvia hispanica]|uniref:UPF0481 protein At3g47200-like isoform X2 n=1 Tax=Salvia hispanica TaxID=49212 RepID=UPI002009557C|nr:UPF0481 protein At3g47200-like isoform X2 [Salvia hispanica]